MIKEPKLKNKKRVTENLRPFWKRYRKEYKKFVIEVNKLEKEMTKKSKLGIDLEFFKVEGECVGIGASEFIERKKFPLISDSELNSG